MRVQAWVESAWNDVRYGIRGLMWTPALLLVSVVSLALGVSVNLTVFALVNAIVLRDVTADRPDRLVRVDVGRASQVSYPNYRDLREAGVFAELAGFTNTEVSWGTGAGAGNRTERNERAEGAEGAERAFAQVVTRNLFTMLGVRAA